MWESHNFELEVVFFLRIFAFLNDFFKMEPINGENTERGWDEQKN